MLQSNTLTLPAELVKNGRTPTIPITPLMKELIGDGLSWGGFSKSKLALDKRCCVSEWTLHDLRRTFASGLTSQGIALPVIEKLLNHISGSFAGIVGVYQRYDLMPEMRAEVVTWEKRISCIDADGNQRRLLSVAGATSVIAWDAKGVGDERSANTL